MPFAAVFQPLNVYLSRVNVFAGIVVLTESATSSVAIVPDPPLLLNEIVLGVMVWVLTALGELELVLVLAITRKS
ncbi:unannotated protein [freshwater metagenome]|uniref:Unannotated protein n=1 Tax=freshwater metagenome TaxID=449393 RepID=A0A6J6J3T6_9ZZZZ